jgi:hypothetical protein
VQTALKEDKFKPLDEIMDYTHEQWNSDLSVTNYDEGWSMVHFLAHGENGKYQQAFGAFMGELGQGVRWQQAWQDHFGSTKGFEQKWKAYWSGLPRNPTLELYIQANTATLCSYLGRAFSQGQTFTSFDAFLDAADKGTLKAHPLDWLPPSLLQQAVKQTKVLIDGGYPYSLVIRRGEHLPQVACTYPDGKQIVSRFVLSNGRIGQITLLVVPARGRGQG